MERVHGVEVSDFLTGLFEGASDGLCLVAPDGTVLRANAKWLRATGLRSEQVVGADIDELFPETRDLGRALHARVRAGERVSVARHRQLILGRESWWDGVIAPVRMEGGVGLLITARELPPPSVERAEAVFADDTEHSRALDEALQLAREQEALRDRQELLDTYFRTPGIGIAYAEHGVGVLDANPAFCAMVGYSLDELRGMDWRRFTHPDDIPQEEAAAGRLLSGEVTIHVLEKRYLRRDGSSFWGMLSLSAARDEATGRVRVLGLVRDIELRKRAELALVESEARLARVLDASADGFFDLDLASGTSARSDRVARMLGREPGDIPPTLAGFLALIHPEDVGHLMAETTAAMAGEREAVDREVRARHADGTWRWLRIRARLERVEGGAPSHFSGVLTDVTEMRRVQEALAASEARYRSLFEQLREDVTVYEVERDASGRAIDWILRASNAEARRFFGEAHQAVVGRRLTEIAGEAHMRPHVDRTEAILAGDVRTQEVFVPLTGRHYLATAFPVDQRTIVTTALDITDRVTAVEGLRRVIAEHERTTQALRDSLEHVKTLKGLLPICMHCHKIRDDQGYWDRIEQYLTDRTEATFSHALCPDCLKQHYPGV